jgi:putative DNA primase/helicase
MISDRMNTADRARGRWKEILPILGIDRRFLVNKHGPCPLCGGKDRYRFDDREGSGSYYCNQCGAGTGIILIRKLNRWDHATACKRIDEIIGQEPRVEPERAPTGSSADARRKAVDDLLRASRHPAVVRDYLTRRGISVSSDVLRGNSYCQHFDEDQKPTGRFPAVIAPIIAPDGEMESAHRIYVADVNPRKKFLSAVRTIKGAAVRLFEPSDTLAVAEGVETSLAVHEMIGLPVWALLNAGNMREWMPPAGISTIAIYGDNDINFVGQAAAFELARKLHAKKLSVTVHLPPKPGTDWLDVLTGAAE